MYSARFEALFEEGREAILADAGQYQIPPVNGGRWGISVVLRPDPATAQRIEGIRLPASSERVLGTRKQVSLVGAVNGRLGRGTALATGTGHFLCLSAGLSTARKTKFANARSSTMYSTFAAGGRHRLHERLPVWNRVALVDGDHSLERLIMK